MPNVLLQQFGEICLFPRNTTSCEHKSLFAIYRTFFFNVLPLDIHSMHNFKVKGNIRDYNQPPHLHNTGGETMTMFTCTAYSH